LRSGGTNHSEMLVTRIIAKVEPGGAQLGVIRLIRALQGLGVGSRLIVGQATPEGRRLLACSRLNFELWGGGGDLQYDCSERFAAWVRPRLAGAELVHGHMFGAWWAASKVIEDGIPLLASEHNAIRWPGSPRREEMRQALARVDACFAHGPVTRATFLALGLPAARLRPASSPIEEAGPGSLPNLPRPRLIFAGRLHPEKGPDILLDALGRLGSPPPTFLLGSGPLAAALRRRAAALGLEATARLVGWRQRIGPWLAGASACVVPSRHEAWSQTAVTAMANRVPVIATAVEGLPLTLAERRGVLVTPEDPDALASAIRNVIAGRSEVDLAGAQRYAASFAADLVAASYARTYWRLVHSEPSTQAAVAA
jgi:glycosyltransferase involved in cell wall biosynthesis